MKINQGVKRDLWIMTKANKSNYAKALSILEKMKGEKKGKTIFIYNKDFQANVRCENYTAKKVL